MTRQGGSRIRQTKKNQVVPEPETAEAVEPADGTHTAEIERRAYEIYLSRNRAPGDPVADWLQAERELRDAKATGAQLG